MLSNNKQNMLELWKNHFYVASSDLSIKKYVDRHLVDFIYDTLKDFWGDDHFNVNLLDLIYKDKYDFVISALNKATLSAFYYLLETCLLISWTKKYNDDVFQKLTSLKYKNDYCKEVLFEIYVDWILNFNEIHYQSNVLVGNQLKEGYCLIGETVFLIECKKRYSLGSQQLKLRQFITGEIFKISAVYPAWR